MELSEYARISILTMGPGANLYDKFGHSAFRVKDSPNKRDIVFNYGTFDFDTPNFYTKFAQGKLLYSLSVTNYMPFYNSYVAQNRWIKTQVLDLTYAQKQALFAFLITNAQPENRDYKYDFLFDNCATRIRDVLVEALGDDVQYSDDYLDETKTFRELIQQNVNWNSWGSLGMDVAIGAVTDIKATPWEHQFLPEYVYQAAGGGATITHNGQIVPLVKATQTIYQNKPIETKISFLISPLFVFGSLGLLLIFMTYKDYRNKGRSRFLDATLFFITGIIGIILMLLWFGTDHSATANNYNILWAFPFSIFFAFAIGKRKPKRWLRRYLMFLILLLALLTLHSITGVQQFAITLIPIFVALAIRYLYVVRWLMIQ
jgi:Domain of unknown function (DUF4105)